MLLRARSSLTCLTHRSAVRSISSLSGWLNIAHLAAAGDFQAYEGIQHREVDAALGNLHRLHAAANIHTHHARYHFVG